MNVIYIFFFMLEKTTLLKHPHQDNAGERVQIKRKITRNYKQRKEFKFQTLRSMFLNEPLCLHQMNVVSLILATVIAGTKGMFFKTLSFLSIQIHHKIPHSTNFFSFCTETIAIWKVIHLSPNENRHIGFHTKVESNPSQLSLMDMIAKCDDLTPPQDNNHMWSK